MTEQEEGLRSSFDFLNYYLKIDEPKMLEYIRKGKSKMSNFPDWVRSVFYIPGDTYYRVIGDHYHKKAIERAHNDK